MIYIYEVGYSKESVNLPPCIKEVNASNPNEGKKRIKEEVPDGLNIRKITLIGSRY